MADDATFRDHAANERTLLAWIRTGIAMMAFGFAIARFGLFLREIATAGPHQPVRGLGSLSFGVALVGLGLLTNAAATVRFGRVRRAIMGRRSAMPSPVLAYALGAGSVLVALLMAVILTVALRE